MKMMRSEMFVQRGKKGLMSKNLLGRKLFSSFLYYENVDLITRKYKLCKNR